MAKRRNKNSKAKNHERVFHSLEELETLKEHNNNITNNLSGWELGRIKKYSNRDGYGFVQNLNNDLSYYFKSSECKTTSIKKGDIVVFQIQIRPRKLDKPKAINLCHISHFDNDEDLLTKKYGEIDDDHFRKVVLSNPHIDFFKIAEKEISNYKLIDTEEDFSELCEKLLFLLNNISKESVKKEISQYISDWAAKEPEPIHKTYLWQKDLTRKPNINEIKSVFPELSKELKNTIIEESPIHEQIQLVNYIFEQDSDQKAYYIWLKLIIQSYVNKIELIVFDLEYDGYSINEIAYLYRGKVYSSIIPEEVRKAVSDLYDIIKSGNILLSGHNITDFDIPILEEELESSLSENSDGIADTIHIETLLSPTLKSYALDTKHNAKADVRNTYTLLVNQIIRLIHLNDSEFQKLSPHVNTQFLSIIAELRENVAFNPENVFEEFEKHRDSFYIAKRGWSEKALEFQKFLTEKIQEPSIIISPKEFFPLLAELKDIQFVNEGSEYSGIVSESKVAQLPEESLERFILESYLERCKHDDRIPLYVNLPGRIKYLIRENATFDFISEKAELSQGSECHICLTYEEAVSEIELIRKIGRKIIIVEEEFISISHKVLLKELEYTVFKNRLNRDSFWMYFTGGESRVEIERKDLNELGIENPPEHLQYFWIEKSSFDNFCVWASFNLKEYIIDNIDAEDVKVFNFSKSELIKENCYYAIPKVRGGQLSITRYNPETRYRNRYWLFQMKMVREVILKDNKPTIYIISNSNEKQNLIDYLISLGFYVPDPNASLLRQISLLIAHQGHHKILIISDDEIPETIHSNELNEVNIILDSFNLEEKWFIAKGTGYLSKAEKEKTSLKFVQSESNQKHSETDSNEDDEIEESTISSSKDVFLLLKIQKPLIDYVRWLFQSNDKNCKVWLTDSRLGDFAGLGEEWNASRKYVQMWASDDEYQEEFKAIKEYFPSSVPKEEIKLELEVTKEALRNIFLKNENTGTTNKWFDYQEDYLNAILPANLDILVTLPTGGGKSVLFQAPALYRGAISGRLTIVITPLKALMEDHVSKLWELKFWGSVEYINSDRKDIQYIYRRIAGGEILLLYITPERFRSRSFVNALKMRLENDGGLEYAVYDEAHCVSQWGLDFRPDYLNSANVNHNLKKSSESKYPLLLFSATVSEQIYNDFQGRFNNSIKRLDDYSLAYNPLREHISIEFETCDSMEEKLSLLAKSLNDGGFNPEHSRCLVFVRRRKDAEENIRDLEERLKQEFGSDSFDGRIAYFHGGMNATERQEVYDAYKEGEILILLATKAFGMGMDIPNIHFIYHLGPSGALEDYLQEVGRAGRDNAFLERAGFSTEKPIQTKCFLEKEDFKRIKTLLRDGKMTWGNVKDVFDHLKEHYTRFKKYSSGEEKPVVIPFNILSQSSKFDSLTNKDHILRLSLYWLEKLERISLGFYAPAQFVFSEFNKPEENAIENDKERKLCLLIEAYWALREEPEDAISIEINKLLNETKISDPAELLKLIFKCQKKGILRFENDLKIYPTKKKLQELRYFHENNKEYYCSSIEAVFEITHDLLSLTEERQQTQFDNEFLEDEKRRVSGEYFTPELFPWFSKSDNNNELIADERKIKKEKLDFERNKVKFSFTLADYAPKIRYRTNITHKIGENPRIVQTLYNGYKHKKEWKAFLEEFKKDLLSLISYTTEEYIEGGTIRYNAADLVVNLGLEEKGIEYADNLISFSKWLGYLHFEGGFLSMGVEFYLRSKKEIREEEANSLDHEIYEEFEKTHKLRELRLIALECLSEISSKESKDSFINDYFSCRDIDAINKLLTDKLGRDHPSLRAFRDEALKVESDRLSDDQKVVYDKNISSNLQVIAGPGSGKTHTLILRVARLIHKENIKPENILVLAYNRAVVVELKERLTTLFSLLGYSNLIHRLKVFTFHAFCKFCLGDSLKKLDFDKWIPHFMETYRTQTGIINNRLGVINYVFVDEFQDITEQRLELLKVIANPENTYSTVIGDPNQSIYGYERVNEGGSRSPRDYYDKHKELYQPIDLRIKDNFRSYPKILEAAERIISYNRDNFSFQPLIPKLNANHHYREVIACDGIDDRWVEKLGQLIIETNPETGQKYRKVAIMFRRNSEIYRAFNLVEKEKQDHNWNIRLRIQGEGEEFSRVREIAFIIEKFCLPYKQEKMYEDIIEDFQFFADQCRRDYPNWEFYYFDLFQCLLYEFLSQRDHESTYTDLLEYIYEIASQDDGQLSRIYYSNIRKIREDRKTEVVLTTMHKVKGLEFDAVIIPASFTNLPMNNDEINDFPDLIEEERRLLYVAYTRAKYRLVTYHGKREQAIIDGEPFAFNEDFINELGVTVPAGFEKYFINWGAMRNASSAFQKIEKEVKVGDIVKLKKSTNNWFVLWEEHRIALLSNRISRYLNSRVNRSQEITGFRVANIYRWTLADTLNSDERNNTKFLNDWTQEAKDRGYIYLVEISGFGKVE